MKLLKDYRDMSGDAKTLDLLGAINPMMVADPETYCKPIVEDFLWKTSGDFFQESEAILNIKKGRQTAFLSNDWPSAIRFMSILECVEEHLIIGEAILDRKKHTYIRKVHPLVVVLFL